MYLSVTGWWFLCYSEILYKHFGEFMGAQLCAPPHDPIFFSFMRFLETFGQMIGLCPLLKVDALLWPGNPRSTTVTQTKVVMHHPVVTSEHRALIRSDAKKDYLDTFGHVLLNLVTSPRSKRCYWCRLVPLSGKPWIRQKLVVAHKR